MNIVIPAKKRTQYLKIGAVYLLLWLVVDLIRFPRTFLLWMLNEIWRALLIVVINYIFFEYILPRLSLQRILRSLFLVVVQIFLCSYVLFAWRTLGVLLHIHTPFAPYTSASAVVADQFGAALFSLVFFGVARHIYHYTQLKRDAQQLRIEKQQAELNYLKSQTNPHFLFNTLNNIYALARDKSDLAPESILRLSRILRYMLYETNGDYIALEEELKIMNNYIELEKLRYDDSLQINFNTNIDNMKQSVPPLLLIPLVENAFKHGVSETRDRPFVDIHLSVGRQQLSFIVKNSADASLTSAGVKENIGLSNLRRQLSLLYTDYHLSVRQEDACFIANLKINLASHV